MPGDFRLQADTDGTRLSASCLFRVGGGFPDVQAALRAEIQQAVSVALAKSQHKTKLTDLQQQQNQMQAKLDVISKELASLEQRRVDPALLSVKDLPAEMETIAVRETVLAGQKKATDAAIAVIQPHLTREQSALDDEIRAAGQQALEQRRQAALERRRELLTELAAAVSPVLTELLQAESECGALLGDGLLNGLGLPAESGVWVPAGKV